RYMTQVCWRTCAMGSFSYCVLERLISSWSQKLPLNSVKRTYWGSFSITSESQSLMETITTGDWVSYLTGVFQNETRELISPVGNRVRRLLEVLANKFSKNTASHNQ